MHKKKKALSMALISALALGVLAPTSAFASNDVDIEKPTQVAYLQEDEKSAIDNLKLALNEDSTAFIKYDAKTNRYLIEGSGEIKKSDIEKGIKELQGKISEVLKDSENKIDFSKLNTNLAISGVKLPENVEGIFNLPIDGLDLRGLDLTNVDLSSAFKGTNGLRYLYLPKTFNSFKGSNILSADFKAKKENAESGKVIEGSKEEYTFEQNGENTLYFVPKTIKFNIEWKDGNGEKRPKEVEVSLKAEEKTSTLNKDNWQGKFEDLDILDNEKEIAYNLEQKNLPKEYSTTIVQNNKEGTEFTIVNTLKEENKNSESDKKDNKDSSTIVIGEDNKDNEGDKKDETAKTFKVIFDANGGGEGNGMPTLNPVEGQKLQLPKCNFAAPEGKIFKAWDINGNEHKPGGTIEIKEDLAIKAIWEDQKKDESQKPVTVQYVITFDANGGSGEMESLKVEKDKEFVLPENKFQAPKGKAFKAWKVDGGELAAGQKVKVNKDTKVSAIWQDKSLAEQVPFDKDAGKRTKAPQTSDVSSIGYIATGLASVTGIGYIFKKKKDN